MHKNDRDEEVEKEKHRSNFGFISKEQQESWQQLYRNRNGEAIGEVGNSGMSTKPHLHYEVMKNGLHVDPIDYLKT
jgi:alpha-L-arabinofuranosidase